MKTLRYKELSIAALATFLAGKVNKKSPGGTPGER
jgi:hypothetical protein